MRAPNHCTLGDSEKMITIWKGQMLILSVILCVRACVRVAPGAPSQPAPAFGASVLRTSSLRRICAT